MKPAFWFRIATYVFVASGKARFADLGYEKTERVTKG